MWRGEDVLATRGTAVGAVPVFVGELDSEGLVATRLSRKWDEVDRQEGGKWRERRWRLVGGQERAGTWKVKAATAVKKRENGENGTGGGSRCFLC